MPNDTLLRWIVEIDGERYTYATREQARWAADQLSRHSGAVPRDRWKCWNPVYACDGIARVIDRKLLCVDHSNGCSYIAGHS